MTDVPVNCVMQNHSKDNIDKGLVLIDADNIENCLTQ